MQDFKDWLTLIVAITGVLSSGVIAYLAYSLNRQAERAQTQRSISDSYKKLIDFRSQHPEVMQLSHLWTDECFEKIYAQPNDENTRWVIYYTYAELCFSFISAVLYGKKSRLLDNRLFEAEYKSLVKLLLTENNTLISSLLPQAKYISSYIIEFRQELEKEGWDWSEMHQELIGQGNLPPTPPSREGSSGRIP
jgi:hypothetical protein